MSGAVAAIAVVTVSQTFAAIAIVGAVVGVAGW